MQTEQLILPLAAHVLQSTFPEPLQVVQSTCWLEPPLELPPEEPDEDPDEDPVEELEDAVEAVALFFLQLVSSKKQKIAKQTENSLVKRMVKWRL